MCAAFQMHFDGGYRCAWRANLTAFVGARKKTASSVRSTLVGGRESMIELLYYEGKDIWVG